MFLYTLGGDHWITYALLKAHVAKHGPLAFIHFDAHPDTWPDDGKKLSHGSFVTRAVKDGLIDPKKSIQIGLRTSASVDYGFEEVDAEACSKLGPDKISDIIHRRTAGAKSYLSFDIDVLDPAYAPGTGTPVPGGLTPREAYIMLRGLEKVNLIGADIVEVSPPYDHADVTANSAAGVLLNLLCLQAQRKRAQKSGQPTETAFA